MSLTGAINIGRTALNASQVGLQVTGNNLANVSTAGYSRQLVSLSNIAGTANSTLADRSGRGVNIQNIRRSVDEALEARLRSATSDEASARNAYQLKSQVESILGTIGENDLSNEFSQFFNAWSERANGTQTSNIVVQQGVRLAEYMQRLRENLSGATNQIDSQLSASVRRADTLLTQIAELNVQIANTEGGGEQEANALRDQRGQKLAELSELMEVSSVDRENGTIDVLVGSTPVVLGGRSRGLELKLEADGDGTTARLVTKTKPERVEVQSGQIGALLAGRENSVQGTLDQLDRIAAELILQVNRLHSTGTTAAGFTSLTGSTQVALADRSRPINDPDNASFAALPFAAKNGGITIQVKNTTTNQTQTVRINVDLDGLTDAGLSGTADDTTINDIVAAFSAISGITGSVTPDGKLKVDAAVGYTFSFTEDTSDLLAVTGVNSFFTGTGAADIEMRSELETHPQTLAVGRIQNGTFVENANALQMALLRETPNPSLGNIGFGEAWSQIAQEFGNDAGTARNQAEATLIVRQNLEGQRASVSGVSSDEESINMLAFQRQYQGAARVIQIADQLMQTLMQLV